REQQASSVRRRQDERLGGRLDELPRRVPEVEALDPHRLPFAPEDGTALARRDCAGLVDLGATEHAPVARRERLGDRGGRPEDVHDDPDRRRDLLGRCEGDVYPHASTLASWPSRDTATGTRTARRGCRARSAAGRSAWTA